MEARSLESRMDVTASKFLFIFLMIFSHSSFAVTGQSPIVTSPVWQYRASVHYYNADMGGVMQPLLTVTLTSFTQPIHNEGDACIVGGWGTTVDKGLFCDTSYDVINPRAYVLTVDVLPGGYVCQSGTPNAAGKCVTCPSDFPKLSGTYPDQICMSDCPANSSRSDLYPYQCTCNTGYKFDAVGGICVPLRE